MQFILSAQEKPMKSWCFFKVPLFAYLEDRDMRKHQFSFDIEKS